MTFFVLMIKYRAIYQGQHGEYESGILTSEYGRSLLRDYHVNELIAKLKRYGIQ